MKKLKYNHPAAIDKYPINKTYILKDLLMEMSLDMVKILFKPIDFEWDDIEVKTKKKRKSDEG